MALAVSTANRAATLPNVPTTAEAGLKDASYHFWTGLFVPVETPKSIIARLYDETRKALDVPSVQQRLVKLGVDPMPMDMRNSTPISARTCAPPSSWCATPAFRKPSKAGRGIARYRSIIRPS